MTQQHRGLVVSQSGTVFGDKRTQQNRPALYCGADADLIALYLGVRVMVIIFL